MTRLTVNWWSKRKLGCVSLALSLAEMLIMWGDITLAHKYGVHPILNVNSATWLLGGLGSFGFAVAGLVADSHRLTAFFAVIAAIMAFFICGLQMLV